MNSLGTPVQLVPYVPYVDPSGWQITWNQTSGFYDYFPIVLQSNQTTLNIKDQTGSTLLNLLSPSTLPNQLAVSQTSHFIFDFSSTVSSELFGSTVLFQSGSKLALGAGSTWGRDITVGTAS